MYNYSSIDYYKNREDRLFSEFEIIIQKLWYLIINHITINKENFDNLELGYSCNCDNFKTLYFATKLIKQIQGYGCLYMVNDDHVFDEVNQIYCGIKDMLNEDEKPINTFEQLIDLLNDN